MAGEEERNFRSVYYDKIGCKIPDEKAIDKILEEKPINISKLVQYVNKFGVTQCKRLVVWKTLLGNYLPKFTSFFYILLSCMCQHNLILSLLYYNYGCSYIFFKAKPIIAIDHLAVTFGITLFIDLSPPIVFCSLLIAIELELIVTPIIASMLAVVNTIDPFLSLTLYSF